MSTLKFRRFKLLLAVLSFALLALSALLSFELWGWASDPARQADAQEEVVTVTSLGTTVEKDETLELMVELPGGEVLPVGVDEPLDAGEKLTLHLSPLRTAAPMGTVLAYSPELGKSFSVEPIVGGPARGLDFFRVWVSSSIIAFMLFLIAVAIRSARSVGESSEKYQFVRDFEESDFWGTFRKSFGLDYHADPLLSWSFLSAAVSWIPAHAGLYRWFSPQDAPLAFSLDIFMASLIVSLLMVALVPLVFYHFGKAFSRAVVAKVRRPELEDIEIGILQHAARLAEYMDRKRPRWVERALKGRKIDTEVFDVLLPKFEGSVKDLLESAAYLGPDKV